MIMRYLFLCGLAAFGASACGEDPDDLAVFDGEMSGAFTEQLSGRADYGIARSGGVTTFTIILGDGGPARITLRFDEDEQPGPGAYAIGAPADPETGIFRGTVDYTTGGALMTFEMRSGTLTIDRSVAGDLDGEFQLEAVRTSPCCDPAPVAITVTGSFDAAPVDTGT